MTTYLGIFAVGLVFMTIAAWKTIEANPHRHIPLHKRTEISPPPIILFQILGYTSASFSAIMLQDRWGLYAYLLFILMILPEFILFSTHNRQLRQHEPPQS